MAKSTKQKSKKRRITFKFEDTKAEEVYLVGDFNDWNTESYPMKNVGNGKWERQIVLQTGKYEYKFMVDGCWMVDPENDQTCQNSFGTYNSVLSLIV